MASIVFLFGRPGSGKSYIARCIKGEQAPVPSGVEKGCLPEDWKIVHITDYTSPLKRDALRRVSVVVLM